MRLRSARTNRGLRAIMAMFAVITALTTVWVYSVQGQAGRMGSQTPPPGPTHDTNITIAGDATALARDERDRAQGESARSTAIAAQQQGKPDPKEEFVRQYTPPVPEPIQTTEA